MFENNQILVEIEEREEENTSVYNGSPNRHRYGLHPIFVEEFLALPLLCC